MVELKKEGQELDVDQFKMLHGFICMCNSQVPAQVSVILAMSIISPMFSSMFLGRRYTDSSMWPGSVHVKTAFLKPLDKT